MANAINWRGDDDDNTGGVVRRGPRDVFGAHPPEPFLGELEIDAALAAQVGANQEIFVRDDRQNVQECAGPRLRGVGLVNFCDRLNSGEKFSTTFDRQFGRGVDFAEWVSNIAVFELRDRKALKKIFTRKGDNLSTGAAWPFAAIAYNAGKIPRLMLAIPFNGAVVETEYGPVWKWLFGLLGTLAPDGIDADSCRFDRIIGAPAFGGRRRLQLHTGDYGIGGNIILTITGKLRSCILEADGPPRTVAELVRLLAR